MRTSKFTNEQKHDILTEQDAKNISVEGICAKHGISIGTFYKWKREVDSVIEPDTQMGNNQELKDQNHKLRRLYMDLSEHNYQLAQFLDK